MVNAMDCGIVVREFVLQLHHYVHFRANTLGKGINPLILPSMGYVVPLLFFPEKRFGIKLPAKVDMPLNKETELYVNKRQRNIFLNVCMSFGYHYTKSHKNKI